MKILSLVAGFTFSVLPTAVMAQSALIDFSSTMFSFSADFTQTVYDSDSVALQESTGRVELLRPGKFRWVYNEPSRQVIVADGLSLWVYDEDIAQVPVQPQSATLGSAPIGLLSGERAIETEFTVTELGDSQGLQWFELKPLVLDTDFNTVFIALDENGMQAMELRDNFEQATQIKFTNFRKNIPIDAQHFTFNPPEGADVIGEVGTVENNDLSQTASQSDLATDDGLPPVVEGEDLPNSTTIIDGNQLQFREITE